MFQLSEHYTQENLRFYIENFERTKRTGCSIVTKRTNIQTLIVNILTIKTHDLAKRIQIATQGSPEGLDLPVPPVAPYILLVNSRETCDI